MIPKVGGHTIPGASYSYMQSETSSTVARESLDLEFRTVAGPIHDGLTVARPSHGRGRPQDHGTL